MYTCLQGQVRLTTCDPLQWGRMCAHHHRSCSWSSSSDQVCPLSALTWKLSEEHLCSFATPGDHSATRCRKPLSVAEVYDRPCHQSWNQEMHQHTYCSNSPDDKIWCISTLGLLLQGSKVGSGHSVAAFKTLCVGFGPRTPPSTCAATGKSYLLSARRESMNSKHSVLDWKRWRS